VPVPSAAHLPNSAFRSYKAMLYFRMLPGSTLAYDYQNSKESKSVVVMPEPARSVVEEEPQIDEDTLTSEANELLGQIHNHHNHLMMKTYNSYDIRRQAKYLYDLTMSAYTTIFQGVKEGVPWYQKFLIRVVSISQSALRVRSTEGKEYEILDVVPPDSISAVGQLKLDLDAWQRELRTREPLKEQYLFFLNDDCVRHLKNFVEKFDEYQTASNQSNNEPLIRSLFALFDVRFSSQLIAVNLFELAKNENLPESDDESEDAPISSQFHAMCLLLIRVWVNFHRWNSTRTTTVDLSVHEEKQSLPESSEFKSTFLGVEAVAVTGDLLITTLKKLYRSLSATTASSSSSSYEPLDHDRSYRETIKKSLSNTSTWRSGEHYMPYEQKPDLFLMTIQHIIEVVEKINIYTRTPSEAEAKQIMEYLPDLVQFMELSIGAFANNSGLDVSLKRKGGGHTPFTA